jgi:hypothetical protein
MSELFVLRSREQGCAALPRHFEADWQSESMNKYVEMTCLLYGAPYKEKLENGNNRPKQSIFTDCSQQLFLPRWPAVIPI